MKIKAAALSLAAILGMMSSACSRGTSEVSYDAISDLAVVVAEESGHTTVTLSGLLTNSAMGISDIKTTVDHGELNVVLFQSLAGTRYSGNIHEEIVVSSSFTTITYGSTREPIWPELP